MATISTIQKESTWGTEATKINQNFTNVNTELTKLNNTYGLKIPLFSSTTEASSSITSPYEGQLILVGSELPAEVYRWNGSSWADTGITGGSASASLTDYYTKEEVDASQAEQDEKMTEFPKIANFGINNNSYVTYNTKNKTLTLPSGSFITNAQDSVGFNGIEINLTDKLSSGACLIYAVMSDTTDVIAVTWRDSFDDVPSNYAMIGYVYNNNVYIYGVSYFNIKVYDDDNNQNLIRGITDKQNNYADSIMNQVGMKNNTAKISYIGYHNNNVRYNTTTKVISLPGGFVTNGNKSMAFSGVEINLSEIQSSANAWIIFVSYNDTNDVKAVSWNNVSTETLSDYCMLGYVYDKTVFINGVNQVDIIIDETITNQKIAVINCSDNRTFIEYDYENKLLKQHSGGYWTFINESKVNTIEQELQLDGSYFAEAYQLFVDKMGNISAKEWTYIGKYNEYYIGYIYKENIYILGAKKENILIKTKTLNIFGDSIQAGVGCNTPYHVHLAKRLGIRALNYGIGSTGYVCTTTNSVMVGNGVEGLGSYQQESGDNTFLRTMQKNSDFEYCSIWGGTNDFGTSVELETFKSAVEETLDYALSITPYVVCATPIKRRTPETNSKGYTLKQYCDIIMTACEERGIPCFDAYSNSGLNSSNDINNEAFYSDGLHINDAGHLRVSLEYEEFVKLLFAA